MLQLWYEECVLARIHTGQIRHCSGASLSTAVRLYAFLEGYELGRVTLAAPD